MFAIMRFCYTKVPIYSGTLLKWSSMGPKKLAVLIGDRINEGFFLQENARPFFQAAKKQWPK